jgi:squalene-hopene/tetraprenyl-beta-curcumene cyclase
MPDLAVQSLDPLNSRFTRVSSCSAIWLVATQGEDGNWEEKWFTGTGFPKVFYLKYHLYRLYFPLTALARFRRMKDELPS